MAETAGGKVANFCLLAQFFWLILYLYFDKRKKLEQNECQYAILKLKKS
jgi:cbb3-type cytochrome oxidase subunit 3